MNQFEIFKKHSLQINNKLSQLRNIFMSLIQEESQPDKTSSNVNECHGDLSAAVASLDSSIKKLEDATFKTLVIGEFKRGKSTFINALLKDKILPAYPTPCTAVINELKWGEEKKATIYFKSEIKNIPEGLDQMVVDHIQRHNCTNVPPLDVDFNAFQKCVVIPDPGKEQAQSVFESPFSKAVIEYPLDICKNGIEIIDSPGLNEATTRNDITEGYLDKVDAIIFVLLCDPLASKSEMDSIKKIYDTGHKSIFYVCNRFDGIKDDDDKIRVINFAKQKLLPFTDLGERGLHFISARDALNFYKQIPPDPKLLRQSRFEPMLKELNDFLINDRGRLKLRQPCELAIVLIKHHIDDVIASVIKGMSSNVEDLKRRYTELERKVKKLKEGAALQYKNLYGSVDGIENFVQSEVRKFVVTMSDNAPGWVNECSPATSLGVFGGEDTVKQIVKELCEYAVERMKDAQQEWETNTMKPAVEERMRQFQDDIKKAVESIGEELRDIKVSFDGDTNTSKEDFGQYFNNIVGVESSVLEGVVVSAIASVLTGLGGALLFLLAPWAGIVGIIVGALTGGLVGKASNNESRMEKIKNQVGEKLKDKILSEGLKSVGDATSPVNQKLKNMIDNTFQMVNQEINQVQANAARQLESCQLAGKNLEMKKLFFEKIKEQKEILLNEFELELEQLSNNRELFSSDNSEDLYTKISQITTDECHKEDCPKAQHSGILEQFEGVITDDMDNTVSNKKNDSQTIESPKESQSFFGRIKNFFMGK